MIAPPVAHAQRGEDIEPRNRQVDQLYREGKYTEAIPLAEQTLVASERLLGKEHRSTLTSANNLASLYKALGRYSDAEALYRQALEGRERVLGPDDRATLESVDDMGELYLDQGRHADAERLFQRALNGRRRALGEEHPDTLESRANLAMLYHAQGRYDEAEPLSISALAASERILGKEHPDTLERLSVRAQLYNARDDRANAELLHRRALEARERVLGREHPATLLSASNLAITHYHQGRYDEAEPLLKRALEGLELILGKEHPNTLLITNNLAALYIALGRYDAAEPYFRRTLETQERILGKKHPTTLTTANNLALLYFNEGRYDEAEPLLKRALEGNAPGDNHPTALMILNSLAMVYQAQGRYGEAAPLMKRALEGSKRVLGEEHQQTLVMANNLATLYQAQGRYNEAELLYKKSLEVFERSPQKDHPNTLLILNNLALLYFLQDRFSDAEPLFRRVVEAHERIFGKEHPNTLVMLNNLAATLGKMPTQNSEAERLIERAYEASARVLGEKHPSTLLMINNLANVYRNQGRHGESEQLLKRALEASEQAQGREHPNTLLIVGNLATAYQTEGRYSEAEQLYKRALQGYRRAFGPQHPTVVTWLTELAGVSFNQGDWVRAAEFLQSSSDITAQRLFLGMQDLNQNSTKAIRNIAGEWRMEFLLLVKAASRLGQYDSRLDAELARAMFEPAQLAIGTEAAKSLAQMAARGAGADPELATLVRKREDLLAGWRQRDARRNAALALSPDKREIKVEAENLSQLSAVEAQIKAISEILAVKFPDYAALASPQPLSIEEVQGLLDADEAVVLFTDTLFVEALGPKQGPAETLIWVVTKTDARWVRSDLDILQLAEDVGALRCGLDAAMTNPRCAELAAQGGAAQQRPFDLPRAHKLYKAIFGKVEDLIKDKHLLIVPSGALTLLPFQVLVTAPPADGDYKSAAWLIRDHAITVLPAVSSLRALRRVARPSAASKPLVGFGNPLLDGPDESYAANARLAWEKQSCSETMLQREAARSGQRGGVIAFDMQGGLADVASIRKLPPLHETTDELCTVARDLGADESALRLGGRATERNIKAMSESGELAQYRIVHFATHGATAGQLNGVNQPGLILTPPDEASEADDGYLSASEIAALRLDADWVILSACNTAAGNGTDAESLSGLARAFIYAQARALLVSHWEVASNTTVTLINTAMREIAHDKSIGRAEALRRAMLWLIDNGKAYEAHPAYWAPFVVVGDGGRRTRFEAQKARLLQ